MDTSKENELMHNLERSVEGGNAGHLADGQPTKAGERSMTVNPTPANVRGNAAKRNQQNKQQKQNTQQYGMTGQAIAGADIVLLAGKMGGKNNRNINSDINSESDISDIDKVTPEMVNRIEMYGAEAVYNAGDEQ